MTNDTNSTNNTNEDQVVVNELEVDVTEVIAATDAVLEFLRDKGNDPTMDLSVFITDAQEAEAKEVYALPLTRWEAYMLAVTLWRAQEITEREMATNVACRCPRCKMMFAFEQTLVTRITRMIPRPNHLPPNKKDMEKAAAEAKFAAGMSGGLN